jgi:UDP-2-acetamido-2-deoxy-ribo-hexuluronate aminotransferase
MEFIDLRPQQLRLETILKNRIEQVLAHQKYIMGPEVKELEEDLAQRVGKRHCVSCANGTDALSMILQAVGIGPGDAVITSGFSFIASADVISMAGATPVFVDIDPQTYNICPTSLASALEELSEHNRIAGTAVAGVRPAGLIVPDLFGQAADYSRITPIAEQYGLTLIEDGAQSMGGTAPEGPCCGLAPFATTSFFPAKPLGCFGDGGAVFTDDEEQAQALASIRLHGKGTHKYDNVRLGFNSRLDTLQAAILLAKLSIFDDEIQQRQTVAARYTEGLADFVRTPKVLPGHTSAWAQYTIEVEGPKDRDDLAGFLRSQGIPTAVYYPRPLHLQTVFKNVGYSEGMLPACEKATGRVLCLPMHPYLETDDQNSIIAAIRQWSERR